MFNWMTDYVNLMTVYDGFDSGVEQIQKNAKKHHKNKNKNKKKQVERWAWLGGGGASGAQ